MKPKNKLDLTPEMEEYGRKCFYEGREVAYYDDKKRPVFKFPTYNGYLRFLETNDPIEFQKIPK